MANLTEIFIKQVLDGSYRYKILNQSPSGKGKTWLAASAAKAFGKAYCFDFDGRIQSLASSPWADCDIEYDTYPITLPSSYDKAYEKLTKLAKGYDVVWLDTSTTLNELCMLVAMPAVKDFYKVTRAHMSGYNIEIPGQSDYQGSGVLTYKFIEKLYTLPCHVIVNAHEQTVGKPGAERIVIDAPGKQQTRIPALFNELWRNDCETPADKGVITPKYVVRVKPNNQYSCRSCWSKALNEIEVADMSSIHSKVVRWCQEEASRRGLKLEEKVA